MFFKILVTATWLLMRALSSAYSPPKPLSVPPSEYWDGVDGQWSTFDVQVGTPGQLVRVLPSTSASPGTCLWTIPPEGCTLANPDWDYDECAAARGQIFNSNASSTYSTQGLQVTDSGAMYSLNAIPEGYLGDEGSGLFGFDSMTLGGPGDNLPTIRSQVVAGVAINNYWLGALGLSPWANNFTSQSAGRPSILSSLREEAIIPSLSWAYTAGAYYNDPPTFGSLTLGGYDTTRCVQNDVNFTFGPDLSQDLLVSLDSITTDTIGALPLLAQSISIFIDSLETNMYLPVSVCEAFEDQLGIEWDNDSGIYFVSPQAHDALIASNQTLTFNVSQVGGDGTNQVQIAFPYAAFDLDISRPITNATRKYFPLRRANDENQYMLGRVFLQEVYVIADYERRNFSVCQALFPSSDAVQDIVPINPLQSAVVDNNSTANSTNSDSEVDRKDGGLKVSALVGVTVGCVVVASALLTALLFIRSRRREAPKVQSPGTREDEEAGERQDRPSITEADADEATKHELDEENAVKTELDGNGLRYELNAATGVSELVDPKSEIVAVELESHVDVSHVAH